MALRYMEIRNRIAAQIDDGTLGTGAQLDPETRLAEVYEVSRPTVRQALDLLERDGYITRTQGRGTFVSERVDAGPAVATRLIGFIAPSLARPFAGQLLAGAESALTTGGWSLSVSATGDSVAREAELVEQALRSGSRGLIIQPTSSRYYNPVLVRLVADRFPIVMVARHYEHVNTAYVEGDNHSGAMQAVGYLTSRGHASIAVISKPFGIKSSMRQRMRGYQEALGHAGLPYRPELVFTDLSDPRSVYSSAFDESIRESVVAQIEGFLRAQSSVTAVLAFNDLIANDTAIAARRTGRDPQRDFAIIGFDDVDVGLPREDLAGSVHVPVHEIGRTGAVALLNRLEEPAADPAQVLLPTTLIVRKDRGDGRVPTQENSRPDGDPDGSPRNPKGGV